MHTRIVETLTPAQQSAVRALAQEAVAVDGVEALSEQTLLHLAAPAGEHRHVFVGADDEGTGSTGERDALLGYAHLDHTGAEPGSEIVVAPRHRRRGVGTALWSALTTQAPDARVWAHGHLDPAQGWARNRGLVVVRELRQMARPLAGLADAEVTLPEGYSTRTFTADDIDAWVALNARAFADHPEQGRVSAADVRARMAEDWFDAAGFFLVEAPATHASQPELAAVHWTKTEGDEGEVYVVGVDPARQGLGLGKSATLLGLRHLAAQGLAQVTLYVDGDNTAALATYDRLGFHNVALDVMYGAGATDR